MFTGIIQDTGTVRKFTRRGGDALIEVATTSLPLDDVKIGDSIAVSGACLTVTALGAQGFTFDVSAETLSRTTLGGLRAGDRVNLEKALRMSDFLGGHLVLGHVDCVGRIVERTARADSIVCGFTLERGLSKYVVARGSVTVDGISLTVNSCEGDRFYVNIIPHTAEKTTLAGKKAGDPVNIETDILGKYVEKLLRPGRGVDMDVLREHGFIE
ncbi:MAG: riboflavin synthase [Pseudomonadota bacterium]|jgi:riboflavin synthase|nr:riboflavin synthase [Syntrophaceae bacterium]MDI9555380.1 riboflavin synthase [Pseudomonadota bacterium]NLX31864.1 riboflavin synthase [Deltaproteobacteria bacterium]HNU84294.1 riboflavin synthase [Syntrophales bacterium]HNZ33771.1 riboflavin synthase [Syntrophales bacterium]